MGEVAWRDAWGRCAAYINLCSPFFFPSVYICVCNYIFSSLGMEPISVPQSEQHGADGKFLLNENSEIRGRASVATQKSLHISGYHLDNLQK